MKYINKIALLGFALLLVASVSACNTVEGFGKDVKSVGQSMENAAAKHTGN